MTKLVVMDMDGVIFEGANFWLEFHHKMKTADEALSLWKKYGKSEYVKLSQLTALIWEGRSADKYFSMIENRKYTPGLLDLFDHLRCKNIVIAIVSSGPWHLAVKAKEDLEIDFVFANRLGLNNDLCFDGTVDVQVDDTAKERTLIHLQSHLAISAEDTLVIGDTASDVKMSHAAAHSIGFRVRNSDVRELFSNVVRGNSLAEAIPLLSSVWA